MDSAVRHHREAEKKKEEADSLGYIIRAMAGSLKTGIPYKTIKHFSSLLHSPHKLDTELEDNFRNINTERVNRDVKAKDQDELKAKVESYVKEAEEHRIAYDKCVEQRKYTEAHHHIMKAHVLNLAAAHVFKGDEVPQLRRIGRWFKNFLSVDPNTKAVSDKLKQSTQEVSKRYSASQGWQEDCFKNRSAISRVLVQGIARDTIQIKQATKSCITQKDRRYGIGYGVALLN